jgi:hypothetical protein
MLHRRHCWCGDSRRPRDGSPAHGLAPLPSSRPCHTLPACCHEGFDVELIFASRSWRTWRRCPSPRPWLALMLAVGGESGSGLLPPPPEPLHLPSTPFNSPWSATTRSRASRHWLWLEGRLAPVLRPLAWCSSWLRGAQSAAGECLRCHLWERKMLGYVGLRALQGDLHGPHNGSDRSGHYFAPRRRLVRPGALVLGLAEVGPRDLVEVLSQPVERLEVLVFVRPPLHVFAEEQG